MLAGSRAYSLLVCNSVNNTKYYSQAIEGNQHFVVHKSIIVLN